jgi:hypothetical protein
MRSQAATGHNGPHALQEMAMPTRPTSPDPTGDTPRASAFGGLGAGLDFFQDWLKAAGSALPNMPGHTANPGLSSWAMPTLDPEELDKRIQDLKTVQFWLEQNSRMVAMTIQGLEVQKMTLSTLKGMNVSMDSLRDALKARNVASDMAAAFGATTAPPAPSPAPSPASPFASRPSAPPASPAHAPEATGSDDPPAGTAPAASRGDASAGAGAGTELINPMRWWDTLTEQFTHLASQASQTAQTVGTSMSDLLAQTAQPHQTANTSATAATEAGAPKASARKAAAGKSPARKAPPKASPKAPAKPAAKR